jgi:radical SAM protein with 4Fe4S-binding SPASM domain
MKRKKGFMDLELFKKIIDQCIEYGIKEVALYTDGESLLHPRFCDMLEYIKGKDLFTILSTNALLMNEEVSRKLIECGLDSLNYSIEGYDKSTYESTRNGGKFETLMENIQRFKKMRDESKSDIEIWVDSVYFDDGFLKAKRFCETFSPYLDAIYFYPLCNQGSNWKDYDKNIKGDFRKRKIYPCVQLWQLCAITWDGKVVPCSYDYETDLFVGDLARNNLKEIWHSPEYMNYRQLHLEGRQREMPICGDCSAIYTSRKITFKSYLFNERIMRYWNKIKK